MCPTSFLKFSTIFVKSRRQKYWSTVGVGGTPSKRVRLQPIKGGSDTANTLNLKYRYLGLTKIKMFYACRHLFPSVRRCPEFSPTRNLHSRPYITLKKIPTVLLFLKLNVKGITVLVFDDVGWDLYEEGVQFALVPLREDPAHLIVVQVKGILK